MAVLQTQHAHGTLIYPSDTKTLKEFYETGNNSTCLYVGVGGNVRVLTVGGDDVTFYGVFGGTFMPVQVVKVFATGTTASGIMAVDMIPSPSSLPWNYYNRVINDGGTVEALGCVQGTSDLLRSGSLLMVPSGYKSGKAYAEIPTNGNGDFTWTRASTALRTNSSGLLESMGSGVPRLSYMYGSCPALLLEPQRTNLALYSEDFSNAYYGKSGSTITSNTTTAPDGNVTADSIIENTATGFHLISRGTFAIGTNTLSVYAKANTRNFIYVALYNGVNDFGAYFNLSNGTIGNIDTGVTASIQAAANGFYRCIITYTSAVSVTLSIGIASANGTRSYTGDGTSGIFIWGAQVEAGSYATTYIPTTTASATRIADSFSRNNIYTNGLITSSGGTWFVELRGNVQLIADSATIGFWLGTSSGTPSINGTLYFRQGGGTQKTNVWKYESGTATQLYTTTTDTTKIAIKWNGTTADIFANGTKVVSATSFTATNMEHLATTGVGRPFFISQMDLFPTPLTDAECQALTTL